MIVDSYAYDPFGKTIKANGVYVIENKFKFSTIFFDKETGLIYYTFRNYDSKTGRWTSRGPLGEHGGLNMYGFVQNHPISRTDFFGLVFNIFYIQFKGLLGHGWIRIGGFQTYDITFMFASEITHGVVKYKVNSATAIFPVWIGFYPSVQVSTIQPLKGVPGQWKYEEQKELFAVNAEDMLKQWDTELRSRKWFGLKTARFEYGSVKDKCCKDATRADVLDCLGDYVSKNPRITYRLPFLNCRSRAKSALKACCLKVGKRESSTVGEVRIDATPVGTGP